MKSLSNVGTERLGDALGESIDDGAKLSIISSYFTVFAYGELKEELSKIDEVRFQFSEPTFIKRMANSKEPREFEVARRAREVGVGGSSSSLRCATTSTSVRSLANALNGFERRAYSGQRRFLVPSSRVVPM